MAAPNSDARKRHEALVQPLFMRWEAAKRMETTIIGLSGYAQSGKDSTAKVFVEELGFQKLAFADALRAVARAANPTVLGRRTKEAISSGSIFADALGDPYLEKGAYEWLKANTTYREFLQNLGTAVRDHLGPQAWVDAAMRKVEEGGKYVISDVRFRNEAEAIVQQGGQVWRIRRVGNSAANDHISEHDLDRWNFDRVLSLPDFDDDLPALHQALKALVGTSL